MIGKKILFFCLTFLLCFTSNGQTEVEILDQANAFFKVEKFVEATPLYSRLLSLQPKNIDYNYKYGTCLLFNSNKKQESIRYLKFATEGSQADPEAFFYLGRAYHLNYLFNDAIRSYDKYANLAGQKAADLKDVSHLIQMCKDGSQLLMNYSEMVVFNKKEIEADKFFRLYDLKEIGGNLLVTADFQSKLDKKKGHTPLIYFPKNASEIYYSSYGESGENGKEIYRRLRKPTSGWGEPELVKGEVNTKYDEDFAYRSQDGTFLYFCSKGHNSMGGYDVFRSRFDKTTDSFIETENLDFAVSSPDDDIFFLVDQNNQNGYFASARQSEKGKLFVYKIRVEKLPSQLIIIAGIFESKIKQNATISIEVQDGITGALIGKFTSKDDGKIVITFPTGGQYKYLMTVDGDSKVYTQTINISAKTNIKLLRQNLVHFMDNGQEIVQVIDKFDEIVLEKDDILAALFVDKAQLEPNSQDYDLDKLDIISQQEKILTEISAPNLTLAEVAANLSISAQSMKDVEIQSADFEQKTTFQLEKEMNKLMEVESQIEKNAADYRASAENSMSRQDRLLESKKLLDERNRSRVKIEDLFAINQKIQDNLVLNKDVNNRAADWEKKSAEILKFLAEDKNAEALAYIQNNKVAIKSGITNQVAVYQINTAKEINDYSIEITNLDQEKYKYEASAKDLQSNIDFLERQLFEKTSANKAATKGDIATKKADLIATKAEISTSESEIEAKRKIKEDLVDELAKFMSVQNSPKPNSIASLQNAKDKWNQLKGVPLSADYKLLAQAIENKENGAISLNNVSNNNKVKPNTELYDEINPSYHKTISEINDNPTLTEFFKAESLLNAERENQSAIQSAIEKNSQFLEVNPTSESAKKKKETLEALWENSNTDLTSYTSKYEEQKAINLANSLTEATIVQSIDKTYEEIYDYLNVDIVSDKLTKLKSLNEHDNQFLSKVEMRINELMDLLKLESAQNPLLAKELQLLTKLNSGKELDITRRTRAILDIENQLTLTSNNQNEKIDSAAENSGLIDSTAAATEKNFADLSLLEQEVNILNTIHSNYSTKKEQILNSSISFEEKIQALTELNKECIARIKTEKKSLNKKAQAIEIAALERLAENLNRDTKQIELNLISKYEEPSSLINRLAENYQSEIDAMNKNVEINSIQREEELVSLNAMLVKALQKEKEKLDKLAQENPTNEQVGLKIELIDQIQSEYAQLLAVNERKLAELKTESASNNIAMKPDLSPFDQLTEKEQEKKVLAEIEPNYIAEKSRIEESKEADKTKFIQLVEIDKNAVSKLVDKKEKLDKVNDAKKIEAIHRVVNDINRQIAANELNLIAMKETPNEFVTRLAKDYLKNKEQLGANPNLTEIEKSKRQLEVDQLLLEAFEKEKEKFSALRKTNPENENLKEKENFVFDQIVAKQNEMALLSTASNGSLAANTVELIKNNPLTQPDNKTVILTSEELRKELLGELNKSLMETDLKSNSIEDLKEELVKIEEYEKGLKKIEKEINSNTSAQKVEEKNQLEVIASELKEIDSKKRKYTITIGDLEREFLATNNVPPKSDKILDSNSIKEKELLDILADDITSLKEIRRIEKQLLKLSDQKIERQTASTENETKKLKKNNEEMLNALKSIPTSSVAERLNKELAVKRVDQLKQEVSNLMEISKTTKNKQEANHLVEKALAKEKQASEILEIALVEMEVAKLTEGKIITLSTLSELEQRKTSLLFEEANYTSEIKNITEELKSAKKLKDDQELMSKRTSLSKERSIVMDQIALIDKKISQLPSQPKATFPAEKRDTDVSFREEVQISSSLEYSEISKVANAILRIEKEIAFLLKSIEKDKKEASKILELAILDGSKSENSNSVAAIKDIQAKEKRLADMKNDLVIKQSKMDDLLPDDPNQKIKIENLLVRGVTPARREVSNSILIPEKGFEVDEFSKKIDKIEVALDNKLPTGLMFRVQVGAFSKPVATEAFQEFNPVTGEKRSNGLTVYMAGLFDKSTSATDALKTIRSLGYYDAFVVAYCDGERISLMEGRRLEESKACAPMPLQNLAFQITPTANDTTKLITRELDYNKALGAAPALPVESKKGLFYTVQIGVYNKPVAPSTIKNIKPLITKRLPNGQIRYSAGVFVSIEEAMPKRQEAIEKGISDAFITAYFGSERISLTEAEQLLQDRGVEIIEKTAFGIVKDVQQRIEVKEKLKVEIVELQKKRFEEGMGIQLVSKEIFNEFPRDLLNRFNKHVSCYFDQNDKHLKSVIFNKIEDIPQIHFLRYDLDTVFIPDYKRTLNQEKDGFKKIVFYVKNGYLEGDVADFIYRLNLRKEYLEMGESMKVILHNVPSNSIQSISNELRKLKIRSVVE